MCLKDNQAFPLLFFGILAILVYNSTEPKAYDFMINRVTNCSKYLLSNICQTFSNELLEQSYFLLTNEILDNDITTKILEIYYKKKEG